MIALVILCLAILGLVLATALLAYMTQGIDGVIVWFMSLIIIIWSILLDAVIWAIIAFNIFNLIVHRERIKGWLNHVRGRFRCWRKMDGCRITKLGTKRWYSDGEKHRYDAPAVEYTTGEKHWWIDGKRHREDGPAIENPTGNNEWYLDGTRYETEDEWLQELMNRQNPAHPNFDTDNLMYSTEGEENNTDRVEDGIIIPRTPEGGWENSGNELNTSQFLATTRTRVTGSPIEHREIDWGDHPPQRTPLTTNEIIRHNTVTYTDPDNNTIRFRINNGILTNPRAIIQEAAIIQDAEDDLMAYRDNSYLQTSGEGTVIQTREYTVACNHCGRDTVVKIPDIPKPNCEVSKEHIEEMKRYKVNSSVSELEL